jgi:hypothetical protein
MILDQYLQKLTHLKVWTSFVTEQNFMSFVLSCLVIVFASYCELQWKPHLAELT